VLRISTPVNGYRPSSYIDMPIERIFIDWQQHALEGAARVIASRFGSRIDGMPPDYSNLVIVTPGGRAARRLQELLTQLAPRRAIINPTFVTAAGLVDILIGRDPQIKIASELERLAAWISALRETPADQLGTWLPHPPSSESPIAWLSLARECDRLATELAAGSVAFADAARVSEELGSDISGERWRLLAGVHDRYERALSKVNLVDENRRRQNFISSPNPNQFSRDRHVVLVATIDLIPVVRTILKISAAPTLALIHAPENLAASFDELGCVINKAWRSRAISLPANQLIVAADAREEAEVIAGLLNSKVVHDQITIGAADPQNSPTLLAACAARGATLHDAQGLPFSRSALFSGLACLLRSAQSSSSADLYQMLHHELVLRIITAGSSSSRIDDPLGLLDEAIKQHLPLRIEATILSALAQHSVHARELLEIVQSLEQTIPAEFGLSRATTERRTLSDWGAALMQLVTCIRPHITATEWLERESEVYTAIAEFCTLLPELSTEALGKITALEALALLLDSLSNTRIPSAPTPDAIELVGWLELHLDDAPNLIVADMNEGSVPEAVVSDPLLNDGLRAALGLTDNARRYARDSYALAAIMASRPDAILCAAQRAVSGEPQLLSRLLLGGDDGQLAQTMLRFYGPSNISSVALQSLSGKARPRSSVKPLGPPAQVPMITQVSVTGLADYLRCPYRYYLRHIERLSEIPDGIEELDSAGFGLLVHTILQEFARGPLRDSADAPQIEHELRSILVDCAKRKFGDPKFNAIQPGVRIQLQQIAGRLSAFATAQARRVSEGWRIVHTEYECDPELAKLVLPGDSTPMVLRGRIDRIDFNERTKCWAVIDYKSGDRAKSPDQLHRRKGRGEGDKSWINLQLPLYHYMLRCLGFEGQIELGIVPIVGTIDDIEFKIAEWTEPEIESALACAIEISRKIRAQQFWPPNGDILAFDEFEPLVRLASKRVYVGGGL